MIFQTDLHAYIHPRIAQRLGYERVAASLPKYYWDEHALWSIRAFDAEQQLTHDLLMSNLLTDNGGTSMLQNAYAATAGAVPVFNIVAIAQGTASSILTSALSTGTPITSLSVTALPTGSSIASGQGIVLTSGSNTQTVTASASASAGATTIAVNSFTPNFAYPTSTTVVPQPAFNDNPSSLVGAFYQALSSGAFVYNNGQPLSSVGYTGNGARAVAISTTIAGTTGNAGQYTEAFICNANPVTTTGQIANHLTYPATPLTNGGSLVIGTTVKV